MSQRIFLHVGNPKTGTTFLQRILWSHRDALRDQGVLLPGHGFADHFRACIDVREAAGRVRDPRAVSGAWQRLVDEMAAWDGDSVVSHELFAPATAEQARRAIDRLAGAEVHVVVTARDLLRQIPAEWQEHLKHRSTLTFAEFVDAVRHEGPAAKWFWRVQDVPAVLDRWGASLPRDRVHLITVPPAGAGVDQLWKRFIALVGVDDTGFDLSAGRSNSSVRAEQAELLRRLNTALGDRLPVRGGYSEMVKSLLAHELLADRPGTRFGLVGEGRDFAAQRSKEMVTAVERLDVDVIGDLQELLPDVSAEVPVSGDAEVSAESVLEESVEALAAVLDRLGAVTQVRDRLVRDMQFRPVRHLLIGQSMRRPLLGRWRGWYWRLMGALPDRLRHPRGR